MEQNDLTPPEHSGGDTAYSVVKGIVGSVPVVGAAASEILEATLGPPITRRRQEWMNRVAEAISELAEKRGISYAELGENPAFVDAVLQATQIAMRTSQEEKLKALRNAVQNSALPEAPEPVVQSVFLNWIDSLTEVHIELLVWMTTAPHTESADESQLFPATPTPLYHFRRFGRYGDKFSELCYQAWAELVAKGLITVETRDPFRDGMLRRIYKVPDIGKQFIEFIRSPFEAHQPKEE